MKTKKNYIVIAFVAVALLFAWGFASTNGKKSPVDGSIAASAGKSSLSASEVSYDFGSISMKDGKVMKEFTITNLTDSNVNLKKVFTSCMCTTAYLVGADQDLKGPFGMIGHGAVPPANEIIEPGESRVIRAVFDPNAHGPAGVGRIVRYITLEDADRNGLDLEIKATVTP